MLHIVLNVNKILKFLFKNLHICDVYVVELMCFWVHIFMCIIYG